MTVLSLFSDSFLGVVRRRRRRVLLVVARNIILVPLLSLLLQRFAALVPPLSVPGPNDANASSHSCSWSTFHECLISL